MLAVRGKDPETFSHCVRVSQAAQRLAQAAGLNEYEQRVAEHTGLFHDIGKIAVPDAILHKPNRLTEEEFEVLRDHPQKSAELISPFINEPFFRDLIPGVLHHHERVDGLGYPHARIGQDLPLMARLVAIVDTFDAMTNDRAYRKGLPEEEVIEELKAFSGRQFDADLVKIYLQARPHWTRARAVEREALLAREAAQDTLQGESHFELILRHAA